MLKVQVKNEKRGEVYYEGNLANNEVYVAFYVNNCSFRGNPQSSR